MKLSIIIPCYNAEKYISRCVDSLLTNSKHNINLEIFLCNDGSSDNTIEVLESLKKNYPQHIHILNHPNMGVYKTRNRALEKVTGEYVWLIDADDTIQENALNIIEDNLSENPDVLSFGYQVENHKGEMVAMYPPNISSPTTGINYLKHNDGRLYLWSNIYRVSFLNDNQLKFMGKSMSLEDSFFNLEVFTQAEKVFLNNDVLYNYHFNQDSISKKPTIENRLKQGESSVNVHKATQKLIQNSPDVEIRDVLSTKLHHSILGFFFSLLKEKYPLDYVKKIKNQYFQENLLPIPKDENLNNKAQAFRKIVNRPQIFLFLCRINLIRK